MVLETMSLNVRSVKVRDGAHTLAAETGKYMCEVLVPYQVAMSVAVNAEAPEFAKSVKVKGELPASAANAMVRGNE